MHYAYAWTARQIFTLGCPAQCEPAKILGPEMNKGAHRGSNQPGLYCKRKLVAWLQHLMLLAQGKANAIW